MPVLEELVVAQRQGTRADKAHLTLQHVQNLRNLVEREAAEESPDARDPRVLADLEERTLGFVLVLELGLELGGARDHRAELQHRKLALPEADATVHEEDRPARVELDRKRDERPQGEPDHDDERTHEKVEATLDRPVPAREHGRTQLEERRTLPRNVLTALHQELRRVRREPHLDPLAVRLLDDLEHRSLGKVGLGQDQLVGSDLVENERKLRARSEELEPGNGLGRNNADELVREPGARRLE